MEIQQKLKDLQSLLESGAITQDEFGSLKNQILGDHFSTTPQVKYSIDNESSETVRPPSTTFKTYNGKRYLISNDISRRPENIVKAGEHIHVAVLLYILSIILSFIFYFVFYEALIANVMRLAQGRSLNLSEFDLVIFVSILLFLAFIGTVIVMFKAGTFLTTAEATHSWRELFYSSRIKPRTNKAGQQAEGGIIAFYYKTSKYKGMQYVGIACECDLPNEMSYKDAKKACAELKIGGHDDWFLPTSAECYQMFKNFKLKGVGNLKEGEYWGDELYDMEKTPITKKVVRVSSDKVKISTLSMKSHGNLARVRPMRIVKVLPDLL